MKFTFSIDMDTTGMDGTECSEVCRLLRLVAEIIEDGTLEGTLSDSFESHCGTFGFGPEG